ncbi:glycosyltransferase family 39 protein [Cyanobacteria bacterium FACHB-63]|nr:glycosyltransferase family 39 protein [Cyanobacteria bacterium FACHB-63]
MIVWGLLLTAITEVLSLGRLLTLEWLVRAWILIGSTIAFIYFRTARKNGKYTNSALDSSEAKLPLPSILLLCSIGFIIAMVGLVALIAPPNNWDSMSYRMPRVVHWIQNHSVAHYPTSYLPQLYQKPWSEFTIMHLQILSGGDYFANLVQWFSMIGSVIGVSLIAKQLGADLRGQISSAVVCATIPMGILQASSTQGDYVVSFWLVCFVCCVLSAVQESKAAGVNSFLTGTSLGLAFFAKATSYIYAFPFFIWLLISLAKRYKWRFWKPVFKIAALVFLINVSHEIRNVDLFGQVLASGREKYTNDIFNASVLLSNIIRNVCLHVYMPIRIGKDLIVELVRFIHKFLSVSVSDPRTTWPNSEFEVPALADLFHEDSAPNTIHLLAIAGTVILLMKEKILRTEKLTLYFICLISNFLLFCLILKWQPWHSRLHLPLFVLLSAFIGTILSNALAHRIIQSKVFYALASILIVSSLPWVFCNQTRPLVSKFETIASPNKYVNIFNTSRVDQYFVNRKYLKNSYVEVASLINASDCSKVGLSITRNEWEYPMWMLLQRDTQKQYRIEQVDVENVSAKKNQVYPHKDFTPCSTITVQRFNGGKLPEDIKVKAEIDR